MKEKFMYLVEKIKELLGFGGPVTSVDLNGAKHVADYEDSKGDREKSDEEADTKISDFTNPNQLGSEALKQTIEEANS